MEEDLQEAGPGVPWHRTIAPEWDRRQSEWLVGIVAFVIVSFVGLQIFDVVGMGRFPGWFACALTGSIAFALLVWRLRASTPGGAALGGLLCLRMLLRMRFDLPWTQTALAELVALFVLTFAATRFGRSRVPQDARERRGRQASQVAANLGVAALLTGSIETGYLVAGLAALAEATADTVSSETGRALGGPTVGLTTWRRVPPGTDGGVSLVGSFWGIAASGVIAAVAVLTGAVSGVAGGIVFTAGCAGVVFDSLLGATLERCGWFGNDLVNFASTAFAASVALQGARFLLGPQPYW